MSIDQIALRIACNKSEFTDEVVRRIIQDYEAAKSAKQPDEMPVNEAPVTLKDFKEDSLGEGYWVKTPTSIDHKYLNISMFLWATFLNTWKPEISKGKQWGSLPMFDRFMREWIPTISKRKLITVEDIEHIIFDLTYAVDGKVYGQGNAAVAISAKIEVDQQGVE